MNSYFDCLGYEVRDRVTGFSGVADSICFDLYGCVMASVVPKRSAKDGERKNGTWFDVKRLEKTSKKPVMGVPSFSMPGTEKGPADKAPRF